MAVNQNENVHGIQHIVFNMALGSEINFNVGKHIQNIYDYSFLLESIEKQFIAQMRLETV